MCVIAGCGSVQSSLGQDAGAAGPSVVDARVATQDALVRVDAGTADAAPDAPPVSICSARPATIDFEHLPTGAAACTNCPVTDELACWGVTFSFTSIVSNGKNRPTWCQWQGPTTNNPGNTPTHVITNGSLTAVPSGFPDPADPTAGYDSGTLEMKFSATPVRVIFTAIVNNSITLTSADVTATGAGGTPNLTITPGTPYTPSGSSVVFRRDTITIATTSGSIASIDFHAQGFTVLIDDMMIAP
jgi:hypothetical protein